MCLGCIVALAEILPITHFILLLITHSQECDYYNTLIVCGKENRLNLVKKLDYYWILMVKKLDSVSLKIDHQPEYGNMDFYEFENIYIKNY